MLRHLANIIEQLDLALEHLTKRDPNNARFGLMLTDNVVELTLHQFAKDEQAKLKEYVYLREGYQHTAALEKALGRHFEAKAKFAKALGILSDEVFESLLTFHSLRNEVYHIGVHHESVLPTLAIFYFKVACDLLGKYEPPFLSWGSNQTLPERAKKHFRGDSMFPGSLEEYRSACATLGQAVGHDPSEVKIVLADHMVEIVEDQDSSIDLLATGGPRKMSRDDVIVQGQASLLAFSEKGKKYAQDHGWGGGSVFALVHWFAENYPLQFRSDPIPDWRKRAEGLRSEDNPHAALKKYRAFMDQTLEIRERLDDGARGVEAYIDMEIDRMRGL